MVIKCKKKIQVKSKPNRILKNKEKTPLMHFKCGPLKRRANHQGKISKSRATSTTEVVALYHVSSVSSSYRFIGREIHHFMQTYVHRIVRKFVQHGPCAPALVKQSRRIRNGKAGARCGSRGAGGSEVALKVALDRERGGRDRSARGSGHSA